MAKAAQKKTDVVAAQSTAEVPKVQDTENASQQTPRLINQPKNHPKEVTALALSRLNAVNANELTITIKGLSDLTTPLVNVYASNMNTMQQMQARIKALEEKVEDKMINLIKL